MEASAGGRRRGASGDYNLIRIQISLSELLRCIVMKECCSPHVGLPNKEAGASPPFIIFSSFLYQCCLARTAVRHERIAEGEALSSGRRVGNREGLLDPFRRAVAAARVLGASEGREEKAPEWRGVTRSETIPRLPPRLLLRHMKQMY